eukprot:TRINITY_DN8299_c0_g2_i2.p1 TRINITY_DN8299_c0_g2~~TRINITY_DN8299_c0_g2_i2.p1  ORF type:complete len:420 (+),score=55.90 TRINITY_DN8299_c0_g2_i2:1300-2559(+)
MKASWVFCTSTETLATPSSFNHAGMYMPLYECRAGYSAGKDVAKLRALACNSSSPVRTNDGVRDIPCWSDSNTLTDCDGISGLGDINIGESAMLSPSLDMVGQEALASHEPKKIQPERCHNDIDFSTLDLTEEDLTNYAFSVLIQHEICSLLQCDELTVKAFLVSCRDGYRNEPRFHNFAHAIQVLHGTAFIINELMAADLELLTPLHKLIACLAALTHDLQHPGFNNGFQQKTNSQVFQKYPSSTLESLHYETSCSLLKQHGLLDNLTEQEHADALNMMKVMIIHTDMSLHSKLLDFVQEAATPVTAKNMAMVLAVILHSADLYTPFKSFAVAHPWTQRLQQEFNNQAKHEQELQLPSLPFMAASGELALARDQVSFISNVALKWYDTMAEAWPSCDTLRDRTKTQLEEWHRQLALLT